MKSLSRWCLPLLGALLATLPLTSCGKKGNGEGSGPATGPSKPAASKPGKAGASPSRALPKEVTKGLPKNMVEAMLKAHREKRLLLVEVFDPECNFCLDMEKVLQEPDVQEAMKPFIYIKVGKDAEHLVEEFALQMTPTFLVYKPDGKPMEDCLEGFRSGKVFIAELKNFQNIFHGKPQIEIPEDDHPNYGKG